MDATLEIKPICATKTRLSYNCAHLRWTKETLTIEYFRIILKKIWVKIFLGENFWGENFWGENFFGLKTFGVTGEDGGDGGDGVDGLDGTGSV